MVYKIEKQNQGTPKPKDDAKTSDSLKKYCEHSRKDEGKLKIRKGMTMETEEQR